MAYRRALVSMDPRNTYNSSGVQNFISGGLAAFVEGGVARSAGIGIFELRFLHPLQQPARTCGDAVARLMGAVVRIGAKEVVELGCAFGQGLPPVQLSHRELILVGGENAAETFLAN